MRPISIFLSFVLALSSWIIPLNPALAQDGILNSRIPVVTDQNGASFDWDHFTLGDLGGAIEGGSFEAPTEINQQLGRSLDRSWEPGDAISDTLKFGDFSNSPVQELSIRQIENFARRDIKDVALSEVRLLADQTVDDLVNEIPGLSDLDLGVAQPIAELADRTLKGAASKFAKDKIGNLLGKGIFKNAKLGDLGDTLKDLNLESIPGIADVPVKAFEGFQDKLLSSIPGIDKLPFSLIFGGLPSFSPVAEVDFVWGPKEGENTYKLISGSKENNWKAPCKQSHCAYIELSTLGHDGDRWNVGGKDEAKGEQMVKGGSGFLGKLFGGKEPTGRPLGPDFKLILTKTNESEGNVTLGISTHVCDKGITNMGCTPFAIGPWEIMTVRETELIFLGIPYDTKVKTSIPGSAQDQIKAIEDKYGLNGSGSSGGSSDDFNKECILKLLKAVPSDQLLKAEGALPSLLKQAQELKLSGSQAAYGIAYALNSFEDIAPSGETKYGHRKALIVSRSGLVPLQGASRTEYLQPVAASDWKAMQKAATQDGITIQLGDTHREYADQEFLFRRQIQRRGDAKSAAVWSAPPGYSEHHTGYALDVADSTGRLIQDSATVNWVKHNAGRFNFRISFPEGNSQGIGYEPWHLMHTSTAAQQSAGIGGSSSGPSLSAIAPTIKKYVTKDKVDYLGLGQALKVDESSQIANEASNYQPLLKDCLFGGSCSPTGKMIHPLPGGTFTSAFGMRIHPVYGTWKLHAGTDVSTGSHSPVLAIDCGKAYTDVESGYGKVVLIDHGNGVWSRYAHLSKQLVPNGATVQQGQKIALEGNTTGGTGGSTGIHLHLEIRQGNRWGNPINPESKIKFR